MNNGDSLAHNNTSIAIIGFNGRFPGAKNINQFWQNLQDGVESISFFTLQELETLDIPPHIMNQPNFVKAKGVLEDIDLFDASFFGFSPKEAEMMDPQHRLFLECSWEVLESVGYNSETYEGAIGVYAGTSMNSYGLLNLYSNRDFIESVGTFQAMISSDKDYLATRVSYKLNLKGPSYTVQTACSTSLVAVHIACQSLLMGECDMALAGGVSIGIPQKSGELYHEGGVASPDGHCRAFDEKAQGTVGGSGVGIVVLKRLEDALSDGDYIHAVIKGSAINNDGSLKVGYTAPSVDGQAQVIAEALAVAKVEPETVTYIEAHGTGTTLGDPIEIAALTKAFRASTQKKGFCALGSVKSNIGHLNAAAGVAGLIKTILALKHKLIPPSLHFEQPNSKIDFANSPFYVNNKLFKWESNGNPLRAGVSSFGIGGTNVHVVLEEPPTVKAFGRSRPYHLLVLSAKTPSALDNATANLAEHLKQNPNFNLADVAYTLQVGRRAFSHRQMLVCQNHKDAVSALVTLDPKQVFTAIQEPKVQPIVFMFPGQGTQYINMASELYQVEPTFCKHVAHCSEFLKPYLGVDLRDILYPKEEEAEEAKQKLNQTFITQPALFTIEYALAKLWIEWGVHPQAMIGHSIGEYVAACLSGVFSLEDALLLVSARGRLMQELPNGAMLAVSLLENEVYSYLGKELSLAAVNSPSLCVISGSIDAVNQLSHLLTEKGVACYRLHTSHAFHSEMVEAILLPFLEQFKKITLKAPKIPYVSNVTGTWITATEATDASYWGRHLRQTVRFAEGVATLLQQPGQILLEVGSGRTLSTLIGQQPQVDEQQLVLSSLRHPKEQGSDIAFLLNTMGKLWLAGVEIDWFNFSAGERRQRIPLPTYPFEKQRYWIEAQSKPVPITQTQKTSYKLEPNIADWFYAPVWKQSVPLQPVENDKLKEKKSRWLIFIDEYGLGDAIAKRLEQEGQDIIIVKVGEQFAKLSDRAYSINPQQRDDYDALLKHLDVLNYTPQKIVHLWGITSHNQTLLAIDSWEASQALGFYSLLFLTQAIGDITDALQAFVITNNLYNIIGDEQLYPEKATVIGASKVIEQEYLNITCRSIDVIFPQLPKQQEKLVGQIVAEFTAQSTDLAVAYRGNHRWVKKFEAVHLETADTKKTRLRQGGVYLITGGLGGIGLSLAEYLAQTVQAKLVLTGRSCLPEKDKWEQWLLTHEHRDTISQKIEKIQVLEQLGAEVLVSNADVTKAEQMQALKTQIYERFGEIHGIIHAAGIAGGGIIQLKTSLAASSVLAPKVKGTLVLDTIFQNEKLDFLVLCSSLNSILGGLGQVDYCAANAFLDEFAHSNYCKQKPLTISINWCGWQDVGMLVNTAVPEELKRRRQEDIDEAMTPKEGVNAFSRILQSGLPQIVVSKRDLETTIQQSYSKFDFEKELVNIQKELELVNVPTQIHSRPQLGNNYVAPRTSVEQTIANIWQQLLGIEQVGIYDNFFELGGHSLLATQVISRVREAFQIDLSIRKLLEDST
ncbi:SDR family NAD(P)-dependent oxidoreductase [Scytonema sp. UIC 10036]|uniref:type I polyketide synthase n=1 Tax=Scytonema sp. UIC 10036 TaxID=2304196 RepID=UPI0012DA32C2|nr:type I polyketide synthase [Scytonema sp. UIC 10036]MUG92153.1 SDR family NAD(P)-dependent oxidoreductase [Scytonema sp. UIC 10036]